MRMLYDHVLIREVKEKWTVLIPEKAKKYPEVGEVVAAGPGDAYGYPASYPGPMKPMTVAKGDKIYYSKDRAAKITLKSETLYVIKERDCYGIIEEGEL